VDVVPETRDLSTKPVPALEPKSQFSFVMVLQVQI
jgi:hypothetical protein